MLDHLKLRAAGLALAASLAVPVVPAHAASSASSAASDSVGTLSGSVSGSLKKSSESSTPKTVAQGDYRIVEVVAVAEAATQTGMLRLTLQHVADASDEGTLLLTLPQAAFARSGLAAGGVVSATPRAYGVEFARSDTREAFFLALTDDWLRQLASNPVTM
jgi:hypothetical protein